MILWLNIRHEKQKTEAAERRSALALSLSYQKNIFLYFIQSKRCRPSLFCFVYLACIHFSACSMCTMHHLPEAIPIRKRSTCLIHSILGMAFFVIQKNVYSWVQHIEQRLYSYTQFGIEILCCCFRAIKSKKIMSRADCTIL